jgi:hypothetical protein
MRHPIPIIAAGLAALVTAAVPATAAPPRQSITVRPRVVGFGEDQVVRGRNWVVFENCQRRVRVRLRSPQNSFKIGHAHVRRSGRFRFEWTPRRARVGAGRWRLVVLQKCESGKDGSTFFERASKRIRIVAHH